MLFGGEGIVLLKLLGLYRFPFFFPNFGFASVDGEINGQDPSWCWAAVSVPAAWGAGAGTVGSACFARSQHLQS